ncbi:uncharacterized protein LOC114249979 [Bombyx mandarina]|uniref:Uncharacterized protein LOC114249979 n=1 Tax=Bombyx mandarina TaxID=7092 RepID=A0A6J2KH34_BOMMA|nr:uncharacterized protein LOC114249979 [Bombyx mandarina]
MHALQILRSGLRLPFVVDRLSISTTAKSLRKRSPCDVCLYPTDKKPCFDLRNVSIEFGNQCHAKLIRSFLYTHFWPREPSVVGLWMSLECPYLEVLTEKYSNSGDRFLAFERIQRTGERKLAGVCVANTVRPWKIKELEEWAHNTDSKPERHRMYFCAHCLKSPNLFAKYNVDYIYDVEVLTTAAEVTGQGLATLLLRTALAHANELRHPLVQTVAVSQYTSKICERVGMRREWSMNYADYVNDAGQRVFFPRRPHHTVAVYVKHFDPKKGGEVPCKPPY